VEQSGAISFLDLLGLGAESRAIQNREYTSKIQNHWALEKVCDAIQRSRSRFLRFLTLLSLATGELRPCSI
jgi:hypothetical protein